MTLSGFYQYLIKEKLANNLNNLESFLMDCYFTSF